MIFRRKRHIVSAYTLRNEFERRSFFVGAMQGGIGVLLAARLSYLAIFENEKYQTQSESNRVNLTLIPPRRGWILDRNGSPLATNRADFRVDIIPERMADPEATVAQLGNLLGLEPDRIEDIQAQLRDSSAIQPIEVASGLNYNQYAAISVRLPDWQGVLPRRGFSRFYPTGSAVGHLLGFVGPASAQEYEQNRDPLFLTPGFKIGKDGLEKYFENELRGAPGARRAEVTAEGRMVRDLETRGDIPGDAVRLSIDGPLQDYASRRLGLQSGSVVVLDCATGDLLCMASMPSFDPNSFSDGIGSLEYAMLRGDERVPLRNKVLKGLYPPASTVKPIVSMSFLKEGLDPEETVYCGGGLQVGNRFFRCHERRGHGPVNMARAVAQSCDVYFYSLAQRYGMDVIADMSRVCGLGQTFPLPVTSQFYGTVPDPEWKMRKYGKPWYPADTVNATIGQGYMLVNPMQLAISAARLATGKGIMPRLRLTDEARIDTSVSFSDEHVGLVRAAMHDVVHGRGTAPRARLPIPDIEMAGKTGTAQVVSLSKSDGRSGPWKFRDHGLFTFFAPFDKPRYAGAVVIEHGGGSGAAYPIARDVMTFLFDPAKGLEKLQELEREWGGNAQERLDRAYAAYAREAGAQIARRPISDQDIFDRVDAEARLAARQTEQIATSTLDPREDPIASSGAARDEPEEASDAAGSAPL